MKKHGDTKKPVILDLRKAFQDVLAYAAAVMGVFCAVSIQASNSGRNSRVRPVSQAVGGNPDDRIPEALQALSGYVLHLRVPDFRTFL